MAIVAVLVNGSCGEWLEDGTGLRWLYSVRGPAQPPDDVVIVSMDQSSKAILDLPVRTRDWPRSLHAKLIDRLVELEVSVIAMDLDFGRDTISAEDDALATAVAASKRVVLVERLDTVTGQSFNASQTQQPILALQDSARALAPAPVPDAAVVAQGWSFLEDAGTRGHLPTFPAAALHVYVLSLLEPLPPLGRSGLPLRLDDGSNSGWSELRATMRMIRTTLEGDPAASSQLWDLIGRRNGSARPLVDALARMYQAPAKFYVNFYGPPGAIRTIPYHEVLDGAIEHDIKGAAVFVGGGLSAVSSDDQVDTYHVPFQFEDADELSGVEIQATIFANLLAGEVLRPVGSWLELSLLWVFGTGVVVLAFLLPRWLAVVAVLTWAATHAVVAHLLFSLNGALIPVIVPLVVLLPFGFIVARFRRPPPSSRETEGVCLATDVSDYSATARKLKSGKLHERMEAYRQQIYDTLTKWSGSVEKPQVADSVSCVWEVSGGDPLPRHRACSAALELWVVLNQFNADNPGVQFPTRIGLHLGGFNISEDVDGDICRLDGDAVNVANRIEAMNKQLFGLPDAAPGPMILASEEVIRGLDDVIVRDLGCHELRGVGNHALYQIVGLGWRPDPHDGPPGSTPGETMGKAVQ